MKGPERLLRALRFTHPVGDVVARFQRSVCLIARRVLSQSAQRLKPLLGALRVTYLIGLAVLAVLVVRNERAEVVGLLDDARPLLIVAALVASFGLILIGAWFWVVGLRTQGYLAPRLRILDAAVLATSRSLLARYVPGSVWFAVGRVGLLRNAGLPIGALSATAVLEMATSLTVVLIAGLVVLGVAGGVPVGTTWLVTVALVLIVATSPAVGGRAVARVAARRGVEFSLSWRGYVKLILVNVGFWGWSALTFVLYLRAFPAADHYPTTLVVGGFLLTWGVGFLAPFAPQGIGVFEVTMATVLGAEGVGGMALALGSYRLVLLARDLIATSVAEFMTTRRALRGSGRRGTPRVPEPVGETVPGS